MGGSRVYELNFQKPKIKWLSTGLNIKNKAVLTKQITFFFCFPPPDLAGLEDGGGALSFFGACQMDTK